MPDKTARHWRRQRTERVCLLLPKLGIPFADKKTADVQAVTETRGVLTLVMTGNGMEGYRKIIGGVEAGLANGIIADAEMFSTEEVDELFEPVARQNRACLFIHPPRSRNPIRWSITIASPRCRRRWVIS